LTRGVDPDHLAQVLVAGLPERVYSPRSFVQRRLIDKMPPLPAAPETRAPHTLMECTDCGVPGRPEALPGGLCKGCRSGSTGQGPVSLPPPSSVTLAPDDIRRRAAGIRRTLIGVLATSEP
ncbi:hypothetical protein ACWD35_06815, partial [Streptomyces sp. NPDC002671]